MAEHSYRDQSGLTARANSALLVIRNIAQATHISPGARLVLIARVLEQEPVLTDGSTAAIVARAEADEAAARRERINRGGLELERILGVKS